MQAVKEAFSSYYETFQLESLDMKAYSSVLLQPLTPEKTLESAVNRIIAARKLEKADFFVSLEGGMGLALLNLFSDYYKANCFFSRNCMTLGKFVLPTHFIKLTIKLD